MLLSSPTSFDFSFPQFETPTGLPGVTAGSSSFSFTNGGCNTPDYPCCAGPTVDPDCVNAGRAGDGSGSSGGGGTLATILGAGLTGLQDILAFRIANRQVAQGQYPSGVQALFGQGGSVLPVSSGWIWIFVIIAIFLLLVKK